MNISDLRELYAKGENIIAYLRAHPDALETEFDPVMVSYDLQAGSYVKALSDPAVREHKELYAREIIKVVKKFEPTSLLEAGVGEATTLRFVGEDLGGSACRLAGFDISWSRVAEARRFASQSTAIAVRNSELVCGDLFSIPYADNSFDVVYTAHSMEPNGGHEREILEELYRVANRALVLLEPGYELAEPEAKARMDRHGYVRDLPRHAEALGYDVSAHRLLGTSINSLNPSALTVIPKAPKAPNASHADPSFVCPLSGSLLEVIDGFYYSDRSLCAYPVLDGIPVLLKGAAILATGLRSTGPT